MKAKLLGFLLIFSSICSFAVEVVAKDDAVFLRNNVIECTIQPQIGRMMQLSFVGGENMLWIDPKAEENAPGEFSWKNYGGLKIWLWPQNDWKKIYGKGWPPPKEMDIGPYSFELIPNGVRLTSPIIPGYQMQIVQDFIIPDDASPIVMHTVMLKQGSICEKNSDACIGLWLVAQVPTTNNEIFAELSSIDSKLYPLDNNDAVIKESVGGDLYKLSQQNENAKAKSGMIGRKFVLKTANGSSCTFVRKGDAALHNPGEEMQLFFSPKVADDFSPDAGPYAELEFVTEVFCKGKLNGKKLELCYELNKPE